MTSTQPDNHQACERCQHWKAGDPVGKVHNAGVCTVMMRNLTTAPYWANDLSRVTISWEGTYCPTFAPVRGFKPVKKRAAR